jgi:uncharacterized protein YydD (DUF2326 family)
MIRRVSSSLPSFKEISFTSGFNIVLADRTKDSTKKDTRNGLGKSTLLDVIHFCLGARVTKANSRLAHPQLLKYDFTLELELNGKIFTATRRLDDPTFLTLSGDIRNLPIDEPPVGTAFCGNESAEKQFEEV